MTTPDELLIKLEIERDILEEAKPQAKADNTDVRVKVM